MGKGYKERRKQKRAQEIEEREKEECELKKQLEDEEESNRKKNHECQLLKNQSQEQAINEKLTDTLSDSDSGRGSSKTTVNDSPKIIKTTQQDQSIENKNRKTMIKGLYNLDNTCFFNVIIQSLAHTSLLIDSLYKIIPIIKEENNKYFSTTTAQLMNIFDEFTSPERKKPNIDPKPMFNSLIQKMPIYKGYDQHDCHELFMNLMLILRAEEIRLRKFESISLTNSDNDDDNPSKMFCLLGCHEPYTTYDSIFSGHILDVITCGKCEKCLMKIEPFLGLLLPLTDRMSPSANYRNQRKRNDFTGNKSKKEVKILSRKQQKALKKQEKKNARRSATGGSGKIRGRQSAKTRVVQEQLPIEETTSLPSTDQPISTNEENHHKNTEDSIEQPIVENNQEKDEEINNENNQEKDEEINNENNQEKDEEINNENNPDDDDDESDDEEPKGPLTAVESTCMLSDMVSKLTLIHETTSRPLPFVDKNIGEKFLNCSNRKIEDSTTTTDDADNITTLEQCFDRYFKIEKLSGENLFDCYYCRTLDRSQKKVLTEAMRQTVFFQLPPVLPVFLKRFQMFGSRSEKIQKFVQFPLQLDLTNRCSSQVISTSYVYSLYAVIEHSGTLRSGHYIVYIKQSVNDNDLVNKIYSKPIDCVMTNLFKYPKDQQYKINKNKTETTDSSTPPSLWHYISDNIIHKVPESKVLEAHAYVLFYRRI